MMTCVRSSPYFVSWRGQLCRCCDAYWPARGGHKQTSRQLLTYDTALQRPRTKYSDLWIHSSTRYQILRRYIISSLVFLVHVLRVVFLYILFLFSGLANCVATFSYSVRCRVTYFSFNWLIFGYMLRVFSVSPPVTTVLVCVFSRMKNVDGRCWGHWIRCTLQ